MKRKPSGAPAAGRGRAKEGRGDDGVNTKRRAAKRQTTATSLPPTTEQAAWEIDPCRHPLTTALMRDKDEHHLPFIGLMFSTGGEGFTVMLGSIDKVDGWCEADLPALNHDEASLPFFKGTLTAQSSPRARDAREQDLHAAQEKILREQFPRLFSALDNKGQWLREPRKFKTREEAETFLANLRGDMMEAWLRAYCADMMQTFKGCPPFAQIPTDVELIVMLAAAAGRATPFDAVDVELANGWEAFGYSTMKPANYCAKINAKLGTRLKPLAMKARALTKLRLTSQRPEGRPANDGELPNG